MRSMILTLAAALCASFAPGPTAAQGEAVGSIGQLKGIASGERGGAVEALDLGASVFMEEVLATGAASRLEVAFHDDTQLTLGEKAKVRVDSFVYGGGRTQMLKVAAVGALRFISAGNKRADTHVVVRTPVVEIGVRGTDFWTGPIDGRFGVLLLKGAVAVSNAAGAVVLDQPGEGTNIAGPGSAPGPVTQWPQQKVDRALAATAF